MPITGLNATETPNQLEAISDRQKARDSLLGLMDYPFDAICFAHGTPIRVQAKAALQRFLDTDS